MSLQPTIARTLLRYGPLETVTLRAAVSVSVGRPVTTRELGRALHEMRADRTVRMEYGRGGTHVAGPRAREIT